MCHMTSETRDKTSCHLYVMSLASMQQGHRVRHGQLHHCRTASLPHWMTAAQYARNMRATCAKGQADATFLRNHRLTLLAGALTTEAEGFSLTLPHALSVLPLPHALSVLPLPNVEGGRQLVDRVPLLTQQVSPIA